MSSLPLKYEVTDNKSSFLCVCKKHTYTQIDLNFMSLRWTKWRWQGKNAGLAKGKLIEMTIVKKKNKLLCQFSCWARTPIVFTKFWLFLKSFSFPSVTVPIRIDSILNFYKIINFLGMRVRLGSHAQWWRSTQGLTTTGIHNHVLSLTRQGRRMVLVEPVEEGLWL